MNAVFQNVIISDGTFQQWIHCFMHTQGLQSKNEVNVIEKQCWLDNMWSVEDHPCGMQTLVLRAWYTEGRSSKSLSLGESEPPVRGPIGNHELFPSTLALRQTSTSSSPRTFLASQSSEDTWHDFVANYQHTLHIPQCHHSTEPSRRLILYHCTQHIQMPASCWS